MKRTPHLFSSETPMAARHRAYPWESTPLGAPARWDSALKTLVPIMLASNQPMFIVWGPQRTLLYNDLYAGILGRKDAHALGGDFLEVWREIHADLEPIVAAAYRGEPVQMDDILLWMERHGFREETHFSFFYSPVRDESGEVAGFFCACAEITAQVLAERRLAQSESRHRGVLDNMGEGFALFDRDFTLLEMNPAGVAMVGLPRRELVGRSHWEVFPGTYDSAIGAMYRDAMAHRQPGALENLYVFPDGRRVWFEVRAFPVDDGLAVFFRDVSARRELDHEAALAAERVQLALDAGAIIGTWVWTVPDDRFIADERFAASFDLDPVLCRTGLPLETVVESVHPDDRVRVEAAVAAALAKGGPYRCEYRVRHRDGGVRWVEANGRVERDEAGRAVRFPGVLLDIEDRRRTEAERDRAAVLLRGFVEAVPGVVYAKDLEGRLILANRGTAELLGCAPEAFIGRTDRELLADAAQAEAVMDADRRVMTSGVSEHLEERVHRADGTEAIWWSTKAPMRDGDGVVVGLIGSSVDITDRKRAEEALRQADRRKDEFLAMLAHELRNPLAPISTAAHMLRLAGAPSPGVARASEIIGRQVGHLTRLVDDLLDVSRVTRGLVELDLAPVDVRAVVSAAAEQARPLIQARGHELRMALGAGRFTVDGDFHRLVQVVANLLNNAAKYTPPGGVVEVRLGPDGDRVAIEVVDNGIGIEPGLLPHVFDLFTQAERTPDRAQGGLGIGLALVRSMVQLHHGEVDATSAGLGRGSTFVVRIPRRASDAPSTPALETTPTAASRRRVLVVDDNEDAAGTLADVLQLVGHQVGVAHGAHAALALAGKGERWDTYILDIGLPEMTGYELGRRLRALPGGASATLIALTGYGQPDDRAVAKAAGFDHHLVKPADVARLVAILDRR